MAKVGIEFQHAPRRDRRLKRLPTVAQCEQTMSIKVECHHMTASESEETERVIAVSASGTADQEELDEAIANAWQAALSDERERAEIAALLGTQEEELDPSIPPFQVHVRGAGTFGAEILIALAAGFAIGVAKGFGEEEGTPVGKAAAKALN